MIPKSQPVRYATSRGAVLILALLITSLVAALAVYLADSFDLTERRTVNRLTGAQNALYIQGAEAIAKKFIRDDNPAKDHLQEDWSLGVSFSPEGFDQTTNLFTGVLEDAQGRFNLNNLIAGNAPPDAATSRPANLFNRWQRRFIRLLQTFEDAPLTEQEAIQITEAVIDWVDADSNVRGFGGAEGLFYSDSGYAPANTAFSSVSELRLIKGMTPELFEQLRQVCVVLPTTNPANINVNTALPNLMRIFNVPDSLSPLDTTDAERLVEDRGSEGFDQSTDFSDAFNLLGLQPSSGGNGPLTDDTAVATSYFLLHSEVTVNNRFIRMNSLIERGGPNASPKVLWRSRGWL